jgi:hypothetical protein
MSNTRAGPPLSVVELPASTPPHVFWRNHVRPNRPAVFRNVSAAAPFARPSAWSETALRARFADAIIKLERRREARGVPYVEQPDSPVFAPRRMRLADFLDIFRERDVYAIGITPHAMLAHVPVPPAILCGSRSIHDNQAPSATPSAPWLWMTQIFESDLWVSWGPTLSQLHYDADQNINCLFGDEPKHWIFIDTAASADRIPWAIGNRYDSRNPILTSGTDYSAIDLDDPALLTSHPELTNVSWARVTQYPGDCMYVPYSHLHRVSKPSTGWSVAVSFMFPRTAFFDTAACDGAPLQPLPLSLFDTLWYYSGEGAIPLGYDDPEIVRCASAQEVRASIFIFVCVCICVSVCLCVCVSVCLCVFVCLSLSLYLSLCLCLRLCLCLGFCLSVCLSVYVSVSMCVFGFSGPVSSYICLFLFLYVCISIGVCLFDCRSVDACRCCPSAHAATVHEPVEPRHRPKQTE